VSNGNYLINGGVRYKDSDDLDDIFNIAITTSEDSSDSNWFIRQLEPGLTRDKLIDYLIEDLDSEVKAFLENCGAVKKHNEVLVAVVLEQ